MNLQKLQAKWSAIFHTSWLQGSTLKHRLMFSSSNTSLLSLQRCEQHKTEKSSHLLSNNFVREKTLTDSISSSVFWSTALGLHSPHPDINGQTLLSPSEQHKSYYKLIKIYPPKMTLCTALTRVQILQDSEAEDTKEGQIRHQCRNTQSFLLGLPSSPWHKPWSRHTHDKSLENNHSSWPQRKSSFGSAKI